MNQSTDPFDPDNLRIDPKDFRQMNQGNGEPGTLVKDKAVSNHGGVRRYAKHSGLKFFQFPVKIFDLLLGSDFEVNRADLAVLLTLYELWFTNFKRNPVKLTSYSLQKYGISRHQKYRALERLENRGLLIADRCRGRSPTVTLTWLPPAR